MRRGRSVRHRRVASRPSSSAGGPELRRLDPGLPVARRPRRPRLRGLGRGRRRPGAVREPGLPAGRVRGLHLCAAAAVGRFGRAGRRLRLPVHRGGPGRIPAHSHRRGQPDRRRGHLLLRVQAEHRPRLRRGGHALDRGARPDHALLAAQTPAQGAPGRPVPAPGRRGRPCAGRGRTDRHAAPQQPPRHVRGRRLPGRLRPPGRSRERGRERPRVRRPEHDPGRGRPLQRGHRSRALLPGDGRHPAAPARLGPGDDRHRPVRGPGPAGRRRSAHHDPAGGRASRCCTSTRPSWAGSSGSSKAPWTSSPQLLPC